MPSSGVSDAELVKTFNVKAIGGASIKSFILTYFKNELGDHSLHIHT